MKKKEDPPFILQKFLEQAFKVLKINLPRLSGSFQLLEKNLKKKTWPRKKLKARIADTADFKYARAYYLKEKKGANLRKVSSAYEGKSNSSRNVR